jgi:hypothetical protein
VNATPGDCARKRGATALRLKAKTIANKAMMLRDFDRLIGLISESTGLLNLLFAEGGANLQPALVKVKLFGLEEKVKELQRGCVTKICKQTLRAQ